MKRAPAVLSGTALGLVGVLSYHAASSPTALSNTTTAGSSARTSTTMTKTVAANKTRTSSAKRTVTGEDVNFRYGDLQVKVTAAGSRITSVSVSKLEVSDPHSDQIDQSAIPQLVQETMSAQSGQIDAVSGASYTSHAYEQSLQSALDKLGITTSGA